MAQGPAVVAPLPGATAGADVGAGAVGAGAVGVAEGAADGWSDGWSDGGWVVGSPLGVAVPVGAGEEV